MKRNYLKFFVVGLLIVSMLVMPVLADEFTFTVSGDTDTATTNPLVDKIDALMQIIESKYYKDIKTEDLENGALKGLFNALDKHSVYFTKEEMEAFSSDISGDFGGLGIYIEKKDDRITVISPIEDTPAYRAGIKSGDQILSVDDTDISNYESENAVKIMRGEPGTKVKIGIHRSGVKDMIYFNLTRELIKINPVKYEIKEGNIGYIRITQFNEHTYENMKKAIDVFMEKNVKGVVIDVRNNPGGLLNQVIDVCKLLIPKGPIVHIDYKSDTDETFFSDLGKAPFKVVMLVNGGSASASEIMAGAIKDSGTGKLVGEKTYGKGTVQTILNLNDGSGLKVTVANYLTPNKFSLDGVGLTPDIEVKSTLENQLKEIAPIKGDRSIKHSVVGLDVLGLQERLITLGYRIVLKDGIFGDTTERAVLKFQKDNHLKQDASMEAADLKVLETKFMEKSATQDNQLTTAIAELKKMIK